MQLIIDGNNLAFRVYYKHKYLSAHGYPTGVIYGGLRSIKRLKEMFPGSSRIVVCWDSRKSLRKNIYSFYKANRKMNPDRKRIFYQMPKLIDALSAIGIPSTRCVGLEADDLLAILCKNRKSLIVSNDEDLYQLLSEKVSMFKPNETIFTKKDFEEQYNIQPKDWPLVLGIAGKKSNNIPGVQGVGVKTAIKYIRGESITDRLKKLIDDNLETTVNDFVSVSELPFKMVVPKIQRAKPGSSEFHKICVDHKFFSIIKEWKIWEQLFFTA